MGGGGKEEEQDGMSVHSPCKAPPSSASSLSKEQSQAELELRFLEALEIYPPGKLKGILLAATPSTTTSPATTPGRRPIPPPLHRRPTLTIPAHPVTLTPSLPSKPTPRREGEVLISGMLSGLGKGGGGGHEEGWGCQGRIISTFIYFTTHQFCHSIKGFSASGIHRHFVLYGVMEFLRRSFDRQFSSEEVMRLLDRFYNLEMLVSNAFEDQFTQTRGDDEDAEFPHREEDFSLPQSYFTKEES
ncbi:Chromatin modification-related protein EAF7 [Bienertia sinuspersici]